MSAAQCLTDTSSAAPVPGDQADPTVSSRLHAVVQQIPELAGKPFISRLLPGGLTNRNYCVTGETGRRIVVRLSSPQSAAFGIDRAAEHANSVSAAAAGVAPKVLAYLPAQRALAIEWIEGPTFTAQDLDDSETLTRVAALCRQLHAGPRFVTEFDMFAIARRYLEMVEDRGYRRPADYLDFLPQISRIEAAMVVRATSSVPCHNDLLPANLMADATDPARLWFIDFEYAGNGDACFDLGNLCSEAGLGPDRLAELVGAYYGTSDAEFANKVSRARLYALMSDYGWTLWACIQAATSELDFDFWSWGLEKYERARAVLRGADLPDLIEEVQRP